MTPASNSVHSKNRGAVLIISMIFVVIFSALAVSMAAMSGTNLQIAENHRKADHARACAESGFDVIRFWLSRVSISGTTAEDLRFDQIADSLQDELTSESITNVTTSCNGSAITIPSVTLDSPGQKSFYGTITRLDNETLQIDITGVYGSITRTIRANYYFGERAHNVFDFGVATKGPLSLSGNIELEGVNVSVEASVYIESENSNLALSIIGNSQIAGDVSIANPIANVFLQGGQAGIGGETGQDAIDNHVSFGVPPSEFPEPDPDQFESFVTALDPNTDTSADATLENIRIPANTNPTFSGQVTLKGIVYIETPNVVTFTGGADITGIIVGDGDIQDNSGVNQIIFLGNVDSHPITELPEEAQFNGLHDQTGTFVMAPGFHVSFGGSFSTLSGAISGNGIEFFGNAGGTINGSVINYSDEEMTLSGNSDLYFNRSGTTEVPAGFVPEIVLEYNPSTYTEVLI
ncbi:MAG: pilus assembly PilX N-terminal domain-containing protein [Sedimentisphaerales bacterium]